MTKKNFSLMAVSITTVLIMSACGSGETTTETTADTTATVTTDTVATAPAAPATVVDIAVGSADHTTLVAAVKAAGLVETLSGAGPFTVFAPTNAAFAPGRVASGRTPTRGRSGTPRPTATSPTGSRRPSSSTWCRRGCGRRRRSPRRGRTGSQQRRRWCR